MAPGLYWRPGYSSHGGHSSGYSGSSRVGKKVARLDGRRAERKRNWKRCGGGSGDNMAVQWAVWYSPLSPQLRSTQNQDYKRGRSNSPSLLLVCILHLPV